MLITIKERLNLDTHDSTRAYFFPITLEKEQHCQYVIPKITSYAT
jgi:hypothetical protein